MYELVLGIYVATFAILLIDNLRLRKSKKKYIDITKEYKSAVKKHKVIELSSERLKKRYEAFKKETLKTIQEIENDHNKKIEELKKKFEILYRINELSDEEFELIIEKNPILKRWIEFIKTNLKNIIN